MTSTPSRKRSRSLWFGGLLVLSVAIIGPSTGIGGPEAWTETSVQGHPPVEGTAAGPTSTATATTPTHTDPTPQPTDADGYNISVGDHLARVTYNCTYFEMDPGEGAGEYFLTLTFRESDRHRYYRFIAGPFRGPIGERFGEAGLLLLTVEVKTWDGGSVYLAIPTRCR